MAVYGQDYDEIRRRNQSFFPNVSFGQAQGMATGRARMDEIASTGTYKSRRDDFRNKYPQFANPVAQQNLQRFDLNQAYAQGYGAPSPAIQQGPGGPYRVAGGVATPYTQPSIFQRTGSAIGGGLRGIGTFAANLGTQFQGAFNAANSFFSGNRPTQSTQSQNFYAYNPSPVPRQPNRYFDY